MWERIRSTLESYPERLRVARTILENGLCIHDDRVFLNQIEIPTAKIARAAGVDRRTVAETVRMVNTDSQLRTIFSQLESAGPSLRGIAKQLGLGVVEITADDPKKVGILAGAAGLLAEAGISIRQALVDDPDLDPDPKLVLITGRTVPGTIIPELLKIDGVVKVSVY
ncbi:MAG: amino acid-binding protein [Thermoproteota archaeon]